MISFRLIDPLSGLFSTDKKSMKHLIVGESGEKQKSFTNSLITSNIHCRDMVPSGNSCALGLVSSILHMPAHKKITKFCPSFGAKQNVCSAGPKKSIHGPLLEKFVDPWPNLQKNCMCIIQNKFVSSWTKTFINKTKVLNQIICFELFYFIRFRFIS